MNKQHHEAKNKCITLLNMKTEVLLKHLFVDACGQAKQIG
jgi:hypothetical protein